MQKFLTWFSILLLTCITSACSNPASQDEIRVGTIAGPETELMQVAANVAATQGLKVKIIEFSDYAIPNTALSEGSLDANLFQHEPYLQNSIKQHHYALVTVAKMFIYPMGIYSKTLKHLSDVPEHAVVAIPNDPTNEARALLLMQKAGLIQLPPDVGDNATPHNITANPKQLNIKEMDAAGLPRVLDDVSLAVINTNYAIPAGLTPNTDALFLEDKNSPYANILVAKANDVNNPKIKTLIEALHSDAVKQEANKLFHDQAIAAW